MNKKIKIALAQYKFSVADYTKNIDKLIEGYSKLSNNGTGIVVFPELAVNGYTPRDLLECKEYVDNSINRIEKIIEASKKLNSAAIFGGLLRENNKLYNAAYFVEAGIVKHIIKKHHLPNYSCFEEQRFFKSGEFADVIDFKGYKLGVIICEDLWEEDIVTHLAKQGAELFIVINASPFEANKYDQRLKIVKKHIEKFSIPIIYLNSIACQDSLVFDGGSFIMDAKGQVTCQLNFFEEDEVTTCWSKENNILALDHVEKIAPVPSKNEQIYRALMFSLREYLSKNSFKNIVLGMSGGIDSALTAVIAADALGPEYIHTIMLDSEYTSINSKDDARICAGNIGTTHEQISIKNNHFAIISSLNFQPNDLTDQNIQARLRGLLLMSISNQKGELLLSTGNKSELAVGYCTLYGDMCGGYNLLQDLYKTEVYELAKWRNKNIPYSSQNQKLDLIPDSILSKAPTAELKPNQKDQDSLPPYDILDKILYQLVEEALAPNQVVEMGYDHDTVHKVFKMLMRSEFKRKQATIGPKISSKCFNVDRFFPITML